MTFIKPRYTGTGIQNRMNEVKRIWVKQYEAEKRNKIARLIPFLVSYSVGFYSGSLGHGWGFWVVTICISFAMFYFMRYLRVTYKIGV